MSTALLTRPGVHALQEGQHRAGAQRPLAEGALLPVEQVFGLQVGVVEHRGLIHVDLFPVRAGAEPAVLHHLEEERRAGVGRGDVEQRDVERQRLGEGDRLLDGLHRLAGQADDEVAPVLDAGLVRPAQGAVRLLHPVALVGAA